MNNLILYIYLLVQNLCLKFMNLAKIFKYNYLCAIVSNMSDIKIKKDNFI